MEKSHKVWPFLKFAGIKQGLGAAEREKNRLLSRNSEGVEGAGGGEVTLVVGDDDEILERAGNGEEAQSNRGEAYTKRSRKRWR